MEALQVEATPEYQNADSSMLLVVKQIFNASYSVPLLLPTDNDDSAAHRFPLRLRLHEAKEAIAHEEYKVLTSANGIDIEAGSEHGLFNGLMTIRQLITQNETGIWSVPATEVEDRPSSEWRGMMLDVVRHFYTAKEVKDFLLIMSLYKFNRFHWHLSDDQGWRLPVDSWPKLAKFAQWREGTENSEKEVDGVRYGGVYTQKEIEDVIKYAASLYIEVIPEIDFPGHVQAAIAAYPELGNTDMEGWIKPAVSSLFGAQNYTLAPTELSFKFIKDVIDEEVKLFPSKYIHIGGDEAAPYQWNASRQAKMFASSNGIAENDIAGVQGSFQQVGMARAALHGKTPLAWEEAAEPSKRLSQQAIVMPWKLWTYDDVVGASRNLTLRGYDVVLCPLAYAYLDQSPGWLTVKQAYQMPLPDGLGHGRVLGGQAEIWTEWLKTPKEVNQMTWPRAAALAERFWQGGYVGGDYDEFLERLVPRLVEMKLMRLGLRRPLFPIQYKVDKAFEAREALLSAEKPLHLSKEVPPAEHYISG